MKWYAMVWIYLWRERRRVWSAWRHFRKYGYFYQTDRQLQHIFRRHPRTAIGQAFSYVLNNRPEFDKIYFPKMKEWYDVRVEGRW